MNTLSVPQPIPYQGSKRRIAPAILQRFPERCARLVEPFAGSAAISLAAASRGRAERFWINDANAPLIDLWREIIRRPEQLADEYETHWRAQRGRERAYFDRVRDRFNAAHAPADLLYLLARCVKAAVRYNASGQFNNTPDNRRQGTRPPAMRARIRRAGELLAGRTRLTSWDYRRVLRGCAEGDLVYMDPPYQGVVGGQDRRYLFRFDHGQLCQQLAQLNERGILFLVSYDGRTGEKTFGEPLPASLELTRLEIQAGRSSQATLLGRREETFESLYLSPALAGLLSDSSRETMPPRPR